MCVSLSYAEEASSSIIETIAKQVREEPEALAKTLGVSIDVKQVFAGAPLIYIALFILSVLSVGLWLYSFLLMKKAVAVPRQLFESMRHFLSQKSYEDALLFCEQKPMLFTDMIKMVINKRHKGYQSLRSLVQDEGKRAVRPYWQKIGLVNDVAVIAPMLGLLGTVLGMFYAFYDMNRSMQSLSSLFDGLGISVGTTVAGLVVSLLAMGLYISLKFRLVSTVSDVEEKVFECTQLLDES